MILNSPVPVVIPDSENGAALTSIQEQVPNQSKSEKLINKGCTVYICLPQNMAASHCHGDLLTTCPTSLPPRPVGNPVMSRNWSKSCRFIHFRLLKSHYPIVAICSIWLIKFFTSLWLPPFFSFCRFSLAGIVCFSHSWRGPSSELPGHCRLSAHSPQHTGKNGAFPPLWSSSFFKCFHSILKETK